VGVCARVELEAVSPSRRVETCMTPYMITLFDTTTVADAIDAILERGLHHIPVLSEGRVVGVVTPRAVIAWLAQNLRSARNPRRRGAARADKRGGS
jgi:CBS domain-containing protein